VTDWEVLPGCARLRTKIEDKVRRKDLCGSVRTVYVLEKLPDVSGPGLVEVGHYNDDSKSNYNLAKGVFLTLTHDFPHRGALGHLWDNLGTNFAGSVSASTLRDYPSARTIKTFKSPVLGLTPTTHFRGALYTCRISA
jgi:hypothetical protein